MHCNKRFNCLSIISLSLCIGLISSCGGGNKDGDNGSNDIKEGIEPLAEEKTKTLGTVIIEERNGKTIFDGWFVGSTDDEYARNSDFNLSNVDQCTVNANGGSTSDAVSNQWNDLKVVGDQVEINAREGRIETLVEQSSGDVVVYSTDERWRSEALPEDAVLANNSNTLFDAMSSVDVPALKQLVLLTPSLGYMSSAGSEVSWEASASADSRIKLKYSAIDFTNQNDPVVVSVDCVVLDDGSFVLDQEMQNEFSNTEPNVVLFAVRERAQQVLNETALLKVVQLSYSRPFKP